MNHAEPDRIDPTAQYVAGHFLGNSFNEHTGPFLFHNGTVGPIEGVRVWRTGLINYARVFPYCPDHELVWNGAAWEYNPITKVTINKVELVQVVDDPVEATLVGTPDEIKKQEIIDRWGKAKAVELRREIKLNDLVVEGKQTLDQLRMIVMRAEWKQWKRANDSDQ